MRPQVRRNRWLSTNHNQLSNDHAPQRTVFDQSHAKTIWYLWTRYVTRRNDYVTLNSRYIIVTVNAWIAHGSSGYCSMAISTAGNPGQSHGGQCLAPVQHWHFNMGRSSTACAARLMHGRSQRRSWSMRRNSQKSRRPMLGQHQHWSHWSHWAGSFGTSIFYNKDLWTFNDI